MDPRASPRHACLGQPPRFAGCLSKQYKKVCPGGGGRDRFPLVDSRVIPLRGDLNLSHAISRGVQMKRVLLILVLVVAAGLSACNSEGMRAIDPAAQEAPAREAAQAEREFNRQMNELKSKYANGSLTTKAFFSAAFALTRSRYGSNAYSDAYSSRVIADAEEFDAGKISKAEFDARLDEAGARLQQQEDAQRHAQNVETTNDLMQMNNDLMLMNMF